MPILQFEDADVLIKLGPKPDTWLLLHSSVLATCPVFRISLSEQWEQGDFKPKMI